MSIYYCFEEAYVKHTLDKAKNKDLVVFDSDGIDTKLITATKARGVHLYDYLNIGSIEKDRSYYNRFKGIRIAAYSGWSEYWVDVTNKRWQKKVIELAKEKKAKGVIGVYLDNADIYWQCLEGLKENKAKLLKSIPAAEDVFSSLLNMIDKMVNEIGLIVMPNGADVFVRELFKRGHGNLIKTVNQEGVLYQDFKHQPKGDTKYYSGYLDWCLEQGLYVRGVEYVKTDDGIKEVIEFYRKHGYQAVYISKHKELRGD